MIFTSLLQYNTHRRYINDTSIIHHFYHFVIYQFGSHSNLYRSACSFKGQYNSLPWSVILITIAYNFITFTYNSVPSHSKKKDTGHVTGCSLVKLNTQKQLEMEIEEKRKLTLFHLLTLMQNKIFIFISYHNRFIYILGIQTLQYIHHTFNIIIYFAF